VNWHGETANGWGVLHNGEMASWNVNVAIGENFASDIQVGYEIQGDGYGAEPHNVYGDINFNYPIQWISLNTSFGTLPSGESDEIIIYYDTQDMEIGDYHCTINILSDSWFAEQVHTHLSVVAVNQTPDDLPQVTRLSGNFPNPFNPSTRIQFSLAESGFVLLDVYNARGQKVSSLIQNYLEAGLHLITWNGKNDAGNQLASGVYYLKLKTGNYNKTHKILMIK
jgi:hypothetical protein